MTTLQPGTQLPDEFQPIAQRLETLGGQFRAAQVTGALGTFIAIVVPAITAVLLVIGFTTPPGWLNTTLGLAVLALMAAAYVRYLHRPLWQRPTFAQIARWIEENAPEKNLQLHNELINAVLLAQDYDADGAALAEKKAAARTSPWIPHVLREIEATVGTLNLASAVPWRRQRRRWYWALGMLAASVFLITLFYGTLAHGFAVLLSPNTFVPHVGLVKIVAVEPGNDTVLAGQPVNFVATVESPDGKVVPARIDIQYAGGKRAGYPMSVFGSENNQYRYGLATAAESLDYIVTAGDSESRRFHIEVLPQVRLVRYAVTATPPAYTHQLPRTIEVAGSELTAARGSLEVPFGSSVEITAELDIPVKEALLDFVEGNPAVMASQNGRAFAAKLPVTSELKYGIRFNDASNRTLKRFPEDAGATASAGALSYFSIKPTPDQPPTVVVTEPGRDIDAKPGDKILLAAQATDDHGLTELLLETAAGQEEKFTVALRWPAKPQGDGKPSKSYAVRHMLELPAGKYKLGDTLRYRFTAVDNRDLLAVNSALGPQATQGQVFSIHFNDSAAAAEKTSKLWDELRKKLQAMLDAQIKLRADAHDLVPAMALADAKSRAGRVGEGQKALRAEMAQVAKDFPFETSMKLVQKALQVLVTEDATSAVDRAADLVLLPDTRTLGPIAVKLRQHQSRIIDALQALLAIASAEKERSNPLAIKEGGDVPNEAKEAWKKLADELKAFEKQQKQVIDSTADLAKKPKDQFDKNDEQKLKDAAALEDKWEKFLSERLVDMSKIAEQDQANVSLLEEMVQMKVELAMAKKALENKAIEIATPLEENGLENAKELTTHIERWLQQQPDRTNWQMEEPVAQNDPKMAELPKQLQDMVGELMDQEEDLTQEMESMGSKWADSLDKGAGWDAMDGPISNMSAQGVTGNQLPKDNEIQGRSGEGREGRASGEMVGAEAEGKGGRRTPTRMTPEPFSSGQVKDKSKDPAGGATGGGKKGGFGGEGLEGSGPDSQKDPMQRLGGRQAALRNGAERLQLQMHAQGFENFKLIEAAVFMQKAEQSMKGNRYQNALYYQQQAVQSLNTAKVLAAGQVHVTMDTTPAMSAKTQKEIENALNGVMPKGYADPVKAYFLKLAEEPGTTGK